MHVSSGSKRGRKKAVNFELNLVPFIDMLSVCICFLLVTAVFINLGSFHVNQAVGSEKLDPQKPQGSVQVSLGSDGQIRFELKDMAATNGFQKITTISGAQGKLDFEKVKQWITSFSARNETVKTVLILPNPTSKYDELIQLMAQFKYSKMDQIGLAPL